MSAVPETEGRITYTIFRDTAASKKYELAETWPEFVTRIKSPKEAPEKAALPLISLGVYGDLRTSRNALRHRGNLQSITGVEGDYDGERVAMEDAAERISLAGIRAVFYTSPSHSHDKPRWRILAPLSREYPPDERARFVGRINGILGGILSGESFTPSQSFYVGKVAGREYASIAIDGDCIDERDEFDASAILPKGKTTTDGGTTDATTDDEHRDNIRTGRSFHESLRALAARFIGRGMSPEDAAATLHGLMEESPERGTARWNARMDEIPRLIESASAKYRDPREGADAMRACIASAKESDGEAWPDPQPLPPEMHPVQSFDMALLPDSLRPWIADVCDRVQCPPDFVAVPIMVALGSLIGRKVRIRPKAQDSWTVVPNVWGCVIGRPGTMKSPAVAEALAPLRRLEAEAREEYQSLHAEYEAEAELGKLRREAAREAAKKAIKARSANVSADALRVESPDEPTLRRYTAHQSSVQALAELLRQNPNGLLIERDELAALLSSLSEEDQAEARGFYLTGADGVHGFTSDTIGRGLDRHVDAVCLSIIGTTQPGKIGRYLRQAQAGGEGDDGLMQRFGLMVWPDSSRDWQNVDRWPDSEARRRAFAVFERLDTLTAEAAGAERDDDCAFLRFAPEGLEAFTEWRTGLETRLRSGELHPALESHFAKYRKTVPALALILHLADAGIGPVGLAATLRALAWAEYLESHALRCYGATVAGEVSAARRILARVRSGALADGFRTRDVYRARWADLTDRDTVRAAIDLLVTHGYLAEVELPASAAGGRPTLAYRTHPSLRDELA